MPPAMPDSLWAATAPPGPECPPLESDDTAEVVVVGAGYTGLSAALHLARAGRRVAVLDAGEPGWGVLGPQRRAGEPGRCEGPARGRPRDPGSGMGRAADRVRRSELRPSSSSSSSDTASNARRCVRATSRADTAPRGAGSTANGRASARSAGPRSGFWSTTRSPTSSGPGATTPGCTMREAAASSRWTTNVGSLRAAIGEGAAVHGASAASGRRPRRRRAVRPLRAGVGRVRGRRAGDERLHRRLLAEAAPVRGAAVAGYGYRHQ